MANLPKLDKVLILMAKPKKESNTAVMEPTLSKEYSIKAEFCEEDNVWHAWIEGLGVLSQAESESAVLEKLDKNFRDYLKFKLGTPPTEDAITVELLSPNP